MGSNRDRREEESPMDSRGGRKSSAPLPPTVVELSKLFPIIFIITREKRDYSQCVKKEAEALR